MRADICAGRHELDHVAHCEYYREQEGLDPLSALTPNENRDGPPITGDAEE
jgi:hypothetical protein